MRNIRKNDIVVLRKNITACYGVDEAGDESVHHAARGKWATERGEKARVLAVYPGTGKLIVEGVSYRYKHVRPNNDNPRGGRLQKEAVIDISNVQPYCGKCDRGVRVKTTRNAEGKRTRVCAVCGGDIGAA